MSGVETLANAIRCLELMEASHAAWEAGEKNRCDAVIDQAAEECGADVLAVIQGGMRIGEIPTPESEHWHEYLQHQRDRLAALEREEADDADA